MNMDEITKIRWETIEALNDTHPRYHIGWWGFVPMVWWI